MDNYGYVIPFKSQKEAAIQCTIDALLKGISVYRFTDGNCEFEGGSFLIPITLHRSDSLHVPNAQKIKEHIDQWEKEELRFTAVDEPLNDPVQCMKIPRVAVFCGEGSHSSWLYFPPLFRKLGLPYYLFSERDLDDAKLSTIDVLVVPGGDSVGILRAMAPHGWEAIKKFVSGGGSYFGLCAGGIIATRTQYHLSLLDCEAVNWQLGSGTVTIKNVDGGHPVFLGCPDEVEMVYNQGPFFGEMTSGETLATYLSFNEGFERRVPEADYESLVGSGAVVTSRYGEGKVLSFATHPEHTKSPETHYLVFNALSYFVSAIHTIMLPYASDRLREPVSGIKAFIDGYRKHVNDFRERYGDLVKPGYVKDLEADLVELEQELSCMDKALDGVFADIESAVEHDDDTLDALLSRANSFYDELTRMTPVFRDLDEQFSKTCRYADGIAEFKGEIPDDDAENGLYDSKLELMINSLNERFVHSILMHELNKNIIPRMTTILVQIS